MRLEIEATEHVSESVSGKTAVVVLSNIRVLTNSHCAIKGVVDEVAHQAVRSLAERFGGAS